jgi:O-methyltransferase
MHLRRILNHALRFTSYELARRQDRPKFPPDFSEEDREIIRFVRPFTMAKEVDRIYPVVNAVRYICQNHIPGGIVECGVWRGGMMMAGAKTLLALGETRRDLYLFDTFEGMVQPTDRDLDSGGTPAAQKFRTVARVGEEGSDWCFASLAEVTRNLHSTDYPPERMHFVKGKVEDTLPASAPDEISILRLDTDWYESSKHELVHLFPRLQPGGVLILDDYGHWVGSRQATDEYLQEHQLRLHLVRVDSACRVAVKP